MKRNLLIALIVSVSQLLAGAGPRIVAPNDPAGAEIREAASALFQHIADGDVGGAKALFDGPPEHLKLLEAQLAFSTRSEELKQAISQRFGNVIGVDGVSHRHFFADFLKSRRQV